MTHALDVYRIEKQRLEVTLAMVGGDVLRGCIFVPRPPFGHGGGVDPAALLNDGDEFFPLELEGGGMRLVSKARVVEVSGLPMDEDALTSGLPMALLEIVLAGGVSHFGSMRLEVRADRPRLLDYLNDCHERFLTLYTDHGTRLVNRAQIEFVRPLD